MRGLIRAERSDAGRRRYRRAVLRRIAFIVFAQRVGFSLKEIVAQLAELPADRELTGKDWLRLSREWKARVEARIAELQRLNISLDQCIGCGCLSLKRCRLSNPGDMAARNGAGARRWLGDPPPDM